MRRIPRRTSLSTGAIDTGAATIRVSSRSSVVRNPLRLWEPMLETAARSEVAEGQADADSLTNEITNYLIAQK